MGKGELFEVWRRVFSRPVFVFFGLAVAFLFYEFNVLLNNWSTIVSFSHSVGFFAGLRLIGILSYGFSNTLAWHSFVSLIVISLLFGMLASLIGFKVSARSSSHGTGVGLFGGLGVFLGAFVPGCAACGIGLVSALGLGAAFINFLPFHGVEISVIAIGLLGFTVYRTSKDLTRCSACQVKFNLENLKGG